MLNFETGVGCGSASQGCGGSECPVPPDLCVKRHDTRPPFKVAMSDCEGPVDLTDSEIVVEASMWFEAKLKSELSSSATEFRFADDVGFQSVSVGDVISVFRSRSPEKMLVTAVDESAKTVQVSRGHGGTTPASWPRGSELAVFRFMDRPAQVESVFEQAESLEGVVEERLVDTLLVLEWNSEHTSVPGCYWVEFKVLKVTPGPGGGIVEWVKRLPGSAQGFMVRVVDSPTSPA